MQQCEVMSFTDIVIIVVIVAVFVVIIVLSFRWIAYASDQFSEIDKFRRSGLLLPLEKKTLSYSLHQFNCHVRVAVVFLALSEVSV